jgi:hypothetical protein
MGGRAAEMAYSAAAAVSALPLLTLVIDGRDFALAVHLAPMWWPQLALAESSSGRQHSETESLPRGML